jgi:hypothetical protein
MIYV